jgi:RpiB/LacA/LacB family sugar-phosphate isomerase
MRLVLGSDHAGFLLKQDLACMLRAEGHEVVDVGTDSEAPVDYPDFAEAVGRAVTSGLAPRGVLIRAAICHDTYSAHQGVEHDDMNVLVLGGRIVGPALAQDLVRAFVGATYSGEERHARRLAKIKALESRFE